MYQNTYSLREPANTTSCVVFSSPHSGSEYPAAFQATSLLDSRTIRSSEDAFVDELFADAPKFGAPLIAAQIARAYVDLNRAADELDPAMVRGVPQSGLNPRVSAGLGVIPRVVGSGQVIRNGKISLMEATQRLEGFYHPYHATLSQLLDQQKEKFGMTILVDCHSMPGEALESAPLVDGQKPDIVIGDRFGAAADRWVGDAIVDIFVKAGFRVAKNAPFAGGYITQFYGRPSRNVHAVQIEMRRSLYMDETSIERLPNFSVMQRKMGEIAAEISALGPKKMEIAAE